MVRLEAWYEYFWVATLRLLLRKMSPSFCDRLVAGQLGEVLGGVSGNVLVDRLVRQVVDLVSVGAEYIVLAAGEVGVDLARQKGILGNIGAAGVVVEGQDQQPDDADDDAEGGEIGRDLEHAGISAERQYRSCGGQ
jgi:hypothetical protein